VVKVTFIPYPQPLGIKEPRKETLCCTVKWMMEIDKNIQHVMAQVTTVITQKQKDLSRMKHLLELTIVMNNNPYRSKCILGANRVRAIPSYS